jgi:predicted phosphohydrolase
MSNLFHFSDPHFSFGEGFKVTKPMDQRSWAIGSPNYVGYIDKIVAYMTDNVTDADITVITGDLGHDLNRSTIKTTLQWMDENLKGIVVVIKGNHDRSWNFPKLRMELHLRRVFLVDEGEIITIGKYTFGCYSNHTKTVNPEDLTQEWYVNTPEEVIKMGERIIEQAKNKETIPVFISHYPPFMPEAEELGRMGIKFYLSGHVHCTNGKVEGGTDWTWYNKAVANTDDHFIGGCYFSTGTTDVLLQKHGVIVKKIPTEQIKLGNPKTEPRDVASRLFSCHPALAKKFHREDPLNEGNTLSGYVCVQKGNLQGSLYITHVNGKEVAHQFIYGVPKMLYPYRDKTTELEIPKASKYIFYEKMNGMNVLFFKYRDETGKEWITAKSKGAPLISDCEYGAFLTLTKKVLDQDDKLRSVVLGNMLGNNKEVQSVSCELYGKEEPHLVNYQENIALRPLFLTRINGDIMPLGKPVAIESNETAEMRIRELQDRAFQINEKYRADNGLPLKYEYNHFAMEGYVMYPINDLGLVETRHMYKVKPKDVEEVHWQSFNSDMQGRVREALKKMSESGVAVSEVAMAQELDMGPKEWGKFGHEVMKFANEVVGRKNHVIILVGVPGSGKSTYAESLNKIGQYTRICQDELGSANACKEAMADAIRRGENVVVDRTNIDVRQRQRWIDLAHKLGVTQITCVVMKTPLTTCLDRVISRKNHPTMNDTMMDGAKHGIVLSFNKSYVEPTMEEGFTEIAVLEPKEKVD